ncbi:hypothetical protein BU23DRAFT_293497 [Bimuria novae-zelandiae CBS 107.79]|uniref:Uncharacterized protein n=1 Tax=Bimuria novae-zelandiae CBS 107.79 TaxID=1447943 RepID=A0A6A5UWS0_9PLEO|nr:hypothetical protein BU23DRAFT_293497 [Bimuria novae-zelandiae CBS 107.79]
MAGRQLRERSAIHVQRDTHSQTLDHNSTNAIPNSQPFDDDDEQLQREERAHRRRMMQLEAAEAEARIENLRRQATSDTTGRSQVQDDMGAGDNYTPAVTDIAKKMPSITPRDIYPISEHKFDPANLPRLHAPSAAAATIPKSSLLEEPQSYIEIDPTSRQILMKRPKGSQKTSATRRTSGWQASRIICASSHSFLAPSIQGPSPACYISNDAYKT